jgi:hypothetical protein
MISDIMDEVEQLTEKVGYEKSDALMMILIKEIRQFKEVMMHK